MAKLARNRKKSMKNKKKSSIKKKDKPAVVPETREEQNSIDEEESNIKEGEGNNVIQNANSAKHQDIADDSTVAQPVKDVQDIPKKKKIKGKAEHRTEPSQSISEFNLTEVGKEKVKLDELIKASQKVSGQVSIKRQLQKAKKLKSLSVPLSRPQLEKIKRTVAYDKVCNEVSKWDTIVKSNRDAEQIVYPLKRPEFHLEGLDTVSERFISKHPVEEAVSKILQTSENVLDQTRTLTAAEEKALQAMSVEEAKLRHNELMKHRALISYKEAKARRQNKIKSKRYHRILKREKLKQMMKEFEELQKTDEKAALEKFLEADKLRILERMTLKHRNTGKWAKQQKIRAKYNPESRSNLKEDIAIGRQLREKISTQLPLQSSITDIEIDPDDKFFEDSSDKYLMEDLPYGNQSAEETFSKSQTEEKSLENKKPEENGWKTVKSSKPKPVKISTVEDEMAFSSEVTCLKSLVPDDITFGDEDLDDKDEDKITINQAFADEEFIAEFQEEKKAADRANKSQGIDLFLPGWGSWGGPGVKISKRKKRRFFIKPLEPPPKKNTLGNVIINEDKDKKASEHQVSHLPFPFSNVKQFESYIRQPIGHTWNTQSSFQNLTAPRVITKMGKIIDPIDSEDVVLEKKTQDVPRKKKQRSSQELKAF